MRVWLSDNGRLKRLSRGVREFKRGQSRALNRARQVATTQSRATFQSSLSGRPHVPKREGRPTTGGRFGKMLLWEKEEQDGETFVAFQVSELEGQAPYWLIQEIGTGESAMILDRRQTVSVKSQRGRLISPTLTWADAQGNYDVSQGRRDQQLRSLQDVKNAPLRIDMDELRIKKEIEGKHYIREGGMQANTQYQASLLELARRTFE